jgi:hypothetical protein
MEANEGGYHAKSKTRSQSNLDGAGSGEKQKIANDAWRFRLR